LARLTTQLRSQYRLTIGLDPPEALQQVGMKPSYQTVAVALGLAPLAWIGCFSSRMPTLICPMPIITILPALFLASPGLYLLAILVPALLFLAWNPGLFRGESQIPRRSWLLLIMLSALSIVYFVGSWRYGNQYQGHGYTVAICAVNGVWLVILWAILYRSARLSSFHANLFFHAALFSWLAWYAFPYLGELP
jgi:hypothetical protein